MKRSLGVALAVAALLYSASVYAADFDIEGDFRVRGVYSDNLSDANDVLDDQTAFSDGRFRLKTTITAGMTSAVVIVDFTNSFNDPGNTLCPGPSTTGGTIPVSGASSFCGTGNFRFGTSSFGGSYNIVGVREAYLKFALNPLKVVLGRKQFTLGHGLILDDTIDVIAGNFMMGPASVTLIDAKLVDTQTGNVFNQGSTGGDTNLYILNLGMNHGDAHVLGLFVTYMNDRNNSLLAPAIGAGLPLPPVGFPIVPGLPGDATLLTIGLTADGSIGPIAGRFEIDFLEGTIEGVGPADIDLEGLNLLVGAGMPIGPANIDLSFLLTSGDESPTDTKINVNGVSGNFVLGNILVNDDINSDRDGQCASVMAGPLSGRMGSGGRGCIGGLGITAVKLSAVLASDICHTELAVIWAQTTEDPAVGADSDLGVEIDLNHDHKLDDNLSIAVNLGYLASGDAWKTLGTPGGGTSPTDDQLKGIISVNYRF
ncbi:MAG: hypothetical protein ABGX83_07680 [Nitrospira sp.]|nr:hypothetical protein [Candidatus Manganitrophaceae bacterium]HIL35470.1 hypothetical protein [Candidatus Manganitrophaceae bacterium]